MLLFLCFLLRCQLWVIDMSIEAMKQALEKTLEDARRVFANSSRDAGEVIGFFYTAMNIAIAEAEKHEVSQEPVAHFGSAYVNENGVHVTTVLGPVAIPHDANLYTHPQPQREPLTDEQIAEFFGVKAVDESFVDFVRAIEAAHGIKEKNT